MQFFYHSGGDLNQDFLTGFLMSSITMSISDEAVCTCQIETLNGSFKSDLIGSPCRVHVTTSAVINSSTAINKARSLMPTVIQAGNFKDVSSGMRKSEQCMHIKYKCTIIYVQSSVYSFRTDLCENITLHTLAHVNIKQSVIQQNEDVIFLCGILGK